MLQSEALIAVSDLFTMNDERLRNRARRTITSWESTTSPEDRQAIYRQFGPVFAHVMRNLELPDAEGQINSLLEAIKAGSTAVPKVELDQEQTELLQTAQQFLTSFYAQYFLDTGLFTEWQMKQNIAGGKLSAEELFALHRASFLKYLAENPKVAMRFYRALYGIRSHRKIDLEAIHSRWIGFRREFNTDRYHSLSKSNPEVYGELLEVVALIESSYRKVTPAKPKMVREMPDDSEIPTRDEEETQVTPNEENIVSVCCNCLVIVGFCLLCCEGCNWITNGGIDMINQLNHTLQHLLNH